MAKFKELESAYDSLNKKVEENIALMKQYLSLANSVSKGQEDLAAKTTAVKKATSEIDSLEKERLKLLQKLKEANSDRIQTNEELKVQLQKQKKTNKDLAREKLGLIGAYEKESKRLNTLRKQYKDVALQYGENSKQAQKLNQQITKLDSRLKRIDASVGQNQRSVGNYKKAIGKLQGAFIAVTGAIAGARSAIKITDNIIKSTQTTGDAFAATLGGMKASYDAFNKSLASGDLKNVFKNMQLAFEAGREYTKQLDDLGDRNRALAVTEAELSIEIEKLKQVSDNVMLSYEERANAAKKAASLEEQILERTQSVRKQAFDAEVNRVATLTGLDKDRVLQFIKNYDEERSIREEAAEFIKREDVLNYQLSNQAIVEATLNGNIGLATALKSRRSQNQEELDNLISSTDSNVKEYAVLLRGYNKSTDEELDKVAQSYVQLQGAEEKFLKETRRINNQLNSNLKQLAKESLNNTKDTENERIQIVLDAQPQMVEAQSVQVTSEKELQDNLIRQWQEYYKTKQELSEDDTISEDEKLKKQMESTALFIDTASQLTNTYFDFQNSNRRSQIDNIERQRDAEVAAAEESGRDTAAIQAKFAKKEAKLREDQAKAEKRQAIFNSIINTALGIVKTAGTLGFPAAIPFIAALAVVGAAQTAAIAARPIPKFKHGSDGLLTMDTPAIVGDGGERELITMPDGKKYLSPARSTEVFLPAGSQVFSGADTKELLEVNESNVIGLEPLLREQRATRKAINKIQVINYHPGYIMKSSLDGFNRQKRLSRF